MRPSSLGWSLVVVGCLVVPGSRGWATESSEPSSDEAIAALIRQLGDAEFGIRETAADRLTAIGSGAADALLAAAESSDDLEVALRARWLVESLPLARPTDPPAVIAALDRYARGDFDTRVQLMHRLLRLDDDAGIEPLARIVRLERTTAGSRIAAALLAREWQADDPAWPLIAPRIMAGIGPSSRPTARLLRTLAEAAGSPSAAVSDEAVAVLRLLDRPAEAAAPAIAIDDSDGPLSDALTNRIFRRAVIDLLAAAGRREEAIREAATLLASFRGSAAESELVATELARLVDHGLPQAATLLDARLDDGQAAVSPLVTYAMALARRCQGDAEGGSALAARAAAAFGEKDVELSRRLQAAMLLARWGAPDWAEREYRSIVGNPEATVAEMSLSGILGSEFLHDQGRPAEAAALLRQVLDGRGDEDAPQILMRLERDPRAVRSRMLYFEACAAAAKGDMAAQRSRLEEALAAYPKDVDALIAWYRLGGDDPAHRADAVARITKAAEQIDEEIQAVPDDATGYNEYAWLVSNSEGDARKALRYAKRALEISFDNPSYLDTLAHCRAATGDPAAAYRTQLLAVRQEPHNVTIRNNLARFREALPQSP